MRPKRHSAKHNAEMLDVGRSRQAFRQSISKHELSTKSNEAKNTTKDQFPDEISAACADINVARIFATYWIFRHSKAGQIILVDASGLHLIHKEITQDFPQIPDFLTTLASQHIFCSRCRQRHRILTTRFPGNGSPIQREDISSVRSARFCVTGPI